MKEKILVTGGAGYIGSVLVPNLLSEGYFVTVLDNFMYGENSLATCFINDNFNIINGDIRDKNLINKVLKDFDIIIHLASLVGAPLCDRDPITADQVNKQASIYIIKNLSDDQRIIMPTTNSAYGKGDENNYCDENSPLNPISSYALQKVEIEKFLTEKNNFISYRLATVFGMSPRMRLDLLVNDFTYRAFTDSFIVLYESHFKRNYIHISDVASAFIFGIQKFDKMKNNIYNVGLSNANVSKLELCNIIKKQLPNFYIVETQYKKDKDQRNYIVSNNKIEKIGFMPKIFLEQGVKELIRGYSSFSFRKYRNS